MTKHPSINKTALITGVTGQDGALLSSFLLGKGYRVVGMRPYAAHDDSANIQAFIDHPNFTLTNADLTDGTPRKCLDNSKLQELEWKPRTNLNDGLYKAYQWYRETNGSRKAA